MGFFTRTKLLPTPPQVESDRLAEIEQAYQLAKREHVDAAWPFAQSVQPTKSR